LPNKQESSTLFEKNHSMKHKFKGFNNGTCLNYFIYSRPWYQIEFFLCSIGPQYIFEKMIWTAIWHTLYSILDLWSSEDVHQINQELWVHIYWIRVQNRLSLNWSLGRMGWCLHHKSSNVFQFRLLSDHRLLIFFFFSNLFGNVFPISTSFFLRSLYRWEVYIFWRYWVPLWI